ncbi:hypothetical protein DL96DRAFT_859154 [Flagelloscypha sp. PMI_526]|nr:hypothetical protein DL96DRAFT_859154 [Flagelloscypha sp. PMI_526]
MGTNISSPVSASSNEKLPFEITLLIFDFALHSHATPRVMFRFSLVSKAIYGWILPRLYHTLYFHDSSHGTRILAAPPSSLLFTRRLFSWVRIGGPDISPFSKLSHLCLWKSTLPGLAGVPVTLPLEELLVFNQASIMVIARLLTSEVTMWRTIQRVVCYGDVRKNWLECPNLVQIFVMHWHVKYFVQNKVILPSSSNFRTYIVSSADLSDNRQPFSREDAQGCPIEDRRLVVLGRIPEHLDKPHDLFWENQAAMWEVALRKAEENESGKITVLDTLPLWSEETSSYITS